MTTITNESITRPQPRRTRRPIMYFVAGLAVASAVAVGIQLADNGGKAAPAGVSPAPVVAPAAQSQDNCHKLYAGRC